MTTPSSSEPVSPGPVQVPALSVTMKFEFKSAPMRLAVMPAMTFTAFAAVMAFAAGEPAMMIDTPARLKKPHTPSAST